MVPGAIMMSAEKPICCFAMNPDSLVCILTIVSEFIADQAKHLLTLNCIQLYDRFDSISVIIASRYVRE